MKHRTYKQIVLATLVLISVSLAGCAGEPADAQTTTVETTDEQAAEQTTEATTQQAEATTTAEMTTAQTTTQTTVETTTEAPAMSDGVADVSFGETVELKNGLKVTVDNVRFMDSYDDGYGQTEPMKGSDYKFMLVDVTVAHEGDKPEFAPLDFDMPALANGGQYDADLYYGDEYEVYEGGQLQPGVTRSGVVIYEVKNDVEAEDVSIHWNDEYYYFDSGVDVSWSDN